MEVTHKAACMVNHRHEKLLSYVKRKHGRTSRSPVCVTAAVEKVDSHLCLLHCGFGPFGFCRTLAYRYHLLSTETSGWNGWKVVDGHTARALFPFVPAGWHMAASATVLSCSSYLGLLPNLCAYLGTPGVFTKLSCVFRAVVYYSKLIEENFHSMIPDKRPSESSGEQICFVSHTVEKQTPHYCNTHSAERKHLLFLTYYHT